MRRSLDITPMVDVFFFFNKTKGVENGIYISIDALSKRSLLTPSLRKSSFLRRLPHNLLPIQIYFSNS